MPQFLQAYGKEIVALLIPFITWALGRFFKPSVRLLVSLPHEFTFVLPQPAPIDDQGKPQPPNPATVQTRSLVIWNDGSAAGTKVEIILEREPQCLNAWPGRDFEKRNTSEGRFAILLESLAPKEIFGCEMLAVGASVPAVLNVRCDQIRGDFVATYPQAVVPPWKRNALRFLMWAGLGALIYVATILVQWLVLQTPPGH